MPVILYEVKNRIATVMLNRPDKMNTFDTEMYRAFNLAMNRFKEDSNAWVCVIHAAGDKAFSAGVDIAEVSRALTTDLNVPVNERLNRFLLEIENDGFCSKPIIAAIHGYCIGEGLSLALGCDLRIAASDAIFSLPEAKVGIPTINAAFHGTNKIGASNILELILLGEKRDAEWAYRTGLINKVVPEGRALEEAMKWAEKIAALSPAAIRISKNVVRESRHRSFDEICQNADAEKLQLLEGNDVKEAIKAFFEKRNPLFTGS